MRSLRKARNRIGSIIIILSLFLLTGCEELLDNQPKAIFVSHYVNYAWGYQNTGFIIDAEGNRRPFNLPENWNYPDSEGYLSSAGMEANLEQLGEISCTLSNRDIAYFANKLEKAQKGKITEPEHRMCDAGSITYAGYLFEPEKDRYRYVFIRQWGDYYSENTSREAEEIYEWLEQPCEGSR